MASTKRKRATPADPSRRSTRIKTTTKSTDPDANPATSVEQQSNVNTLSTNKTHAIQVSDSDLTTIIKDFHKKFTLFGKLPLELRRKIWGFATPKPDIIKSRGAHPANRDFNPYFRLIEHVPAVLHTCRESREEFLHQDGVVKNHPTYKEVAGLARWKWGNKVYIAFDADVVIIGSRGAIQSPSAAPHFRHVAIELDEINRIDFWHNAAIFAPRLQLVTVLVEPGRGFGQMAEVWRAVIRDCPEVDGEIDIAVSHPGTIVAAWWTDEKRKFYEQLNEAKANHPRWIPPAIKFRALNKMIEQVRVG